MSSEVVVTCEVARKASADSETVLAIYDVPLHGGMTVMDLLRYIADEIDGSFAFYEHACKRGFCGSCLVKVNGKNMLSCRTLVSGESLRIEPALATGRDFWPVDS
jgi:succinate dehydrogenase/fumarate reductase-like Fe-S protein